MSIFYASIHTKYRPLLQPNVGILHGKYISENIAHGGDPCGEEKVPFCTNRSKKSISLGNLTVLSLQTKKRLLRHTRIVHSWVFMFWVCLSVSFDEKLLEIFYVCVLATLQPQDFLTCTAKYCSLLGAQMLGK